MDCYCNQMCLCSVFVYVMFIAILLTCGEMPTFEISSSRNIILTLSADQQSGIHCMSDLHAVVYKHFRQTQTHLFSGYYGALAH